MIPTSHPASDLVAEISVRRTDGFSLDVQLSLDAGETCALLGPNGAGKSTVVDVLAGLQPLDRGQIALAGRTLDRRRPDSDVADVFVPPEERGIGVVFQQYLLFDHLTVEQNVAFGPRSTGATRSAAQSIAIRWLDELGIAPLAARRPATLSGGQAQRVALARALATSPSLLLLDEPLAALDVTTRSDLRRALRRHLDSFDGPKLLITHDPADAFLLADTVHVIEEGRLTQSGTVDSIRSRPATPYVAALAGTNLLTGTNTAGTLVLDGHPQNLQTADTHTEGAVLITIHPTAVSLHRQQPHGSPRNTWRTRVAHVEPLGEVTRITLGRPIPLAVDITPASTAALGLGPGEDVWASVKATEVGVTPVT